MESVWEQTRNAAPGAAPAAAGPAAGEEARTAAAGGRVSASERKPTPAAAGAVCAAQNGACVALGYFDGVHLGHRLVLTRAVERARALGCGSAAFTFTPPQGGGIKGKAILTPGEKRRRMAALGVGRVECPPFESFCTLSPEEFVEQILMGRLCARAVFCGENFAFGRGRVGNADTLRRLCAAHGVPVEAMPLLERDGAPVSSSRIRALLEAGDLPAANALLGEPYEIDLPVRHGKRLGRTLGFPTINQIYPPEMLLPRQGVYVTRVLLNGRWLPGATGLGTRPSVESGGAGVTCETFIPDFAGELYGDAVRVRFCAFLWPTQKYDSLQALQAMVQRAAAASQQWEDKTQA